MIELWLKDILISVHLVNILIKYQQYDL